MPLVKAVGPPPDPMQESDLKHWRDEIPGSLLVEREAAVLESWLTAVFGYRLVQIGNVPWPGGDPLEVSPIRHKIRIGSDPQASGHAAIADPGQLPLASDSIDLVVLPHTLDFCADPRRLLREVERILIAGGRLITVNFNPWSLWGLRGLLTRPFGREKLPWTGNFVGYVRLSDWLSLLGLEIERTEVMMFRPPSRTEAIMRRSEFLERLGRRFWPMLAGVYLVQAVKRVQPLTPIRPNWQRLRRLSSQVLEPTTRGEVNGSNG